MIERLKHVDLKRFNIRVYGIYINPDNELIIHKENYNNRQIIKFPGGGLKLGEGCLDGLKREFREELNTDIKIIDHFYTTDFCQISAFNPIEQIISIYYRVLPLLEPSMWIKPSFIESYFKPIAKTNPKDFTFPIDQKVAHLLLEKSL